MFRRFEGVWYTLLLGVLYGFVLVMGLERAHAVEIRFDWQFSQARTDGQALPESEIIRTDIWCNSQVIATVPAPDTSVFVNLAPGSYQCAPQLIATRYSDGSGEIASALDVVRIDIPYEYVPPEPPRNFVWVLLLAVVDWFRGWFA